MPIDPSIPLQAHTQIADPLESYGKLMQIQHQQMQMKQQQAMAPLQQQLGQQQVDEGQLALEQKRRTVADMQALDQAFSQPGGRDAIINNLPAHIRPLAIKQFQEQDKLNEEAVAAAEKADTARVESFGRAAVSVREHQYAPIAAQGFLSDLKQKYASDPVTVKKLQDFEQQIQANPTPEAIKAIIDPIIASSSQRKVDISQMDATARLTSANKPTETTLAIGAANNDPEAIAALERLKPPAAPSLQQKDVLIDGKPAIVNYNPKTGQLLANGQDVTAQAKPLPPASVQYPKPDDEPVALTPAGVDAAAISYHKTGTLPPMGMGKQGAAMRAKIMNRSAEMFPDDDIAANKANFAADKTSLGKLQQQRDAIGSFEQTAGKNIDIFLKEAGKVVDTGSPMANTIARMVSGKMLGSSDQAGYDAARQVAINEIAKITSNPNLSGSLSDSARHEVDAFNPREATLKQTVEVMRILKQDMQNRTAAMDEQLKAIRGRISGKSSGESAAPAPAGPSGVFSYQDYLKQKGGK